MVCWDPCRGISCILATWSTAMAPRSFQMMPWSSQMTFRSSTMIPKGSKNGAQKPPRLGNCSASGLLLHCNALRLDHNCTATGLQLHSVALQSDCKCTATGLQSHCNAPQPDCNYTATHCNLTANATQGTYGGPLTTKRRCQGRFTGRGGMRASAKNIDS